MCPGYVCITGVGVMRPGDLSTCRLLYFSELTLNKSNLVHQSSTKQT